jgi:hypothetical protein
MFTTVSAEQSKFVKMLATPPLFMFISNFGVPSRGSNPVRAALQQHDTQSKFARADLEPNTVEVSKKYFPYHENPYSLHCKTGFGISLYASRISDFVNFAPIPAFLTLFANSFAELIVSFLMA